MKPLQLSTGKWVIASDPYAIANKAIEYGSAKSPVAYRQVPAMFWCHGDRWVVDVTADTLQFDTEAAAKQYIEDTTPSST